MKYVEDLNLILINDEIEFNKSNSNSTKNKLQLLLADIILLECKYGDLVYDAGNGKYRIIDRQKALNSPICDDWIAECCATAQEMADGLPRFISSLCLLKHDNVHDVVEQKDGYSWGKLHNVVEGIPCIKEDAELAILLNDIYGWEYTQLLLNDNSEMVIECKKYGNDYYVPSIGEYFKCYYDDDGNKKNPHYIELDHTWTSSLCNDNFGFLFTNCKSKLARKYIRNYICVCSKKIKYGITPFLHLTPANILIGDVNEDFELIKMDNDEINFTKSDLSQVPLQQVELALKLEIIDNCNYHDKLWKSKTSNKFRITDKSVMHLNGYKHVANCCSAKKHGNIPHRTIFSAVTSMQMKGKITAPDTYDNYQLSNDDGWHNTQVFLKSVPADLTYLCYRFYKMDKHLYIPAILELILAHKTGTLDHISSYESSTCWKDKTEPNELYYIYDKYGGLGSGWCNDFKLQILPFYRIEPSDIELPDKIINENVNLLLLNNDDGQIVFSKSDVSSAPKQLVEYDLKKIELEKCIPGKTILYKFRDGYKIEHQRLGIKGIGTCCASAAETPDGLPRFCMDTPGKSCEWSQKAEYIPELGYMDWDTAENDMNGYSNTKIIKQVGKYCSAVNECQKLGNEFYLPSIGELKLAHKHGILDGYGNYLSSNLRDEIYAYSWSAADSDIYQIDKHDDRDIVLPFIMVMPEKLYLKNEGLIKK